jgi:hypothetical protein
MKHFIAVVADIDTQYPVSPVGCSVKVWFDWVFFRGAECEYGYA